jgi:LytS/YehU family sensor histidine kinase
MHGCYYCIVSGTIKKKQRLKSEYEKKLANVEMSALLAQMNPHFLFNSLNSIDSYIIRNESKKASEYLNNFARLMRLILQNSRSNYINLKDELEALDLYMQMESLRFKNKFSYSIAVEGLDTSSIVIPPMRCNLMLRMRSGTG